LLIECFGTHESSSVNHGWHGVCTALTQRKDLQMAAEITWGRDFDAALASAKDKLVLLDFSAAPM